MLKSQAILEVRKNERIYQFSFYSDAPLGELHDALYQMRSFVVEKMANALNLDQSTEVVEGENV